MVTCVLLCYTNDMLVASQDMDKITRLKENLNCKYDMKDLRHFQRTHGM